MPTEPSRRSRRRALVLSAFGVLGAYAMGLAISGRMSLVAQRPMLEGTNPPPPYRWTCPPTTLRATNVRPFPGQTNARFNSSGSVAKAMQTQDGQLAMTMPAGVFSPEPDGSSVLVRATPECASALAPLPDGFRPTGNAYRLEARYQPGGAPVAHLNGPLLVVAVYSVAPTIHSTQRTLFFSPDGRTWEPLHTTDTPASVELQGSVPAFGYVVTGAMLESIVSAPAARSSTSARIWLLLVGAVLIVALAFVAFARRRRASD
jgi:hypothetical protein